MRAWWQDLLIGSGAGLIVAAVVAIAGEAAHLFDSQSFDLTKFLKTVTFGIVCLGTVLGLVSALATIIETP